MPTLSKHYAIVTLPNGDQLEPISVDVTADETWAPYIQATIVLPSSQVTDTLDPRLGDRIKLRLQQDFGDLIYVYEVTADFGGDVSDITAAYGGSVSAITRAYTKPWNIFEPALPLSTLTAAYGGDVSNMTAAGLTTIWKISDFLHGSGTFNPAPSTIFNADLGVRSISYDYISKEATISASSDEAMLQDHPYSGELGTRYSLRELINSMLGRITATLSSGTADFLYPSGYTPAPEVDRLPTYWDFAIESVQAASLNLYCDESRSWNLVVPSAVSGALNLKDNDNITSFTKQISRDGNWFNYAVVTYKTPGGGPYVDKYFGPDLPGTADDRGFYKYGGEIYEAAAGAAQTLVERGYTRGETYEIEAIANFDARPRQTLTIDINGEPVKTGIVQAVTWSLPSARMSIDIRDLQEV